MLEFIAFLVFGYIIIVLAGFSHDPLKRYYNKLFDATTYLLHFVTCLTIAILGVSLAYQADRRLIVLTSPLFFLIGFGFFDLLVQYFKKRHIIIAFRGDILPPEHKFWPDGLLTVLLILLPILLPFLLQSLIMDKS